MNLVCRPTSLRGTVEIPGSKSHTIRAVAIAALAAGRSRIRQPLISNDTQSAVRVYSGLGATFECGDGIWEVEGTGGELRAPSGILDVGNSGTTLNIALGSCALIEKGTISITGDEQIQRRPAGALASSLNDLGARVLALRGNGCPPFEIEGTLRGGATKIEAFTSQFLSSLLMCTPLAREDSAIDVPLLNEAPYVGITLDWLKSQGIVLDYDPDYRWFRVPGRQHYAPVDRRIPGDFSSATFFLAAGALPGNAVCCSGLDMNDTQGDKAVVEYLRKMGAAIDDRGEAVEVRAKELVGCDLDLNATPDALPMMAVMACFASGTTRLLNCPQARVKETDRIAVMREELSKMGARITELPDGLVIEQSDLQGTEVDGHGDHRVVMSLAIAASAAKGATTILGAEAADVTYPGFLNALKDLGAHASKKDDD